MDIHTTFAPDYVAECIARDSDRRGQMDAMDAAYRGLLAQAKPLRQRAANSGGPLRGCGWVVFHNERVHGDRHTDKCLYQKDKHV